MPAIDTSQTRPDQVVVVEATTASRPDAAVASRTAGSARSAGRAPVTAGPPVWDRFIRVFHWTLLAAVSTLVASAHFGQQEMHMALGLATLGLLAARLAWGFVGSPHARFASFAVSPFEALRYLGEIARGRPRHYVGHNPAGAWMVFILLGLLFALALTGLVLQATLEFEGPFVDALRGLSDPVVREVAIAHRLAIDVLYVAVPLHLAGVALASVQHRENLVLAMITGRKQPSVAAAPTIPPKE